MGIPHGRSPMGKRGTRVGRCDVVVPKSERHIEGVASKSFDRFGFCAPGADRFWQFASGLFRLPRRRNKVSPSNSLANDHLRRSLFGVEENQDRVSE